MVEGEEKTMILIILAAVLVAAAPILVHEWGHASALVTRWIG